ncbi:hypothetical protein BDP55DRAFT_673742 [Colletotrichum godetiae]|uniref:Uncharacterized protein n=1 Tax=Colletotrichum godetiae TaxID=1209918 RepID=A0AAJ0ADZ9_9PEZI|nr:uncharacterized protein BDP55DRAFT_673742 [Colletotrichum godetiae]KAK1672147.1 hypothetical protein BDP55DRAFT_673742 [Colletotrichum godetiae]
MGHTRSKIRPNQCLFFEIAARYSTLPSLQQSHACRKKGCYPRPRRTGAGSGLECRAGGGGYWVARSWPQKRRRTRHSKGIELTRVLWGSRTQTCS